MALTASDIDTSKTSQHTARLEKIGMALEALRNVIKANPGKIFDLYFWYRMMSFRLIFKAKLSI